MNHQLNTRAPSYHSGSTWWDSVHLLLITIILIFAVLAFGGTEAWSQLILAMMVAAAVTFVFFRWVFDTSFSLQPRMIWLPTFLLVVLHIVQLIPLPQGIIKVLSPHWYEANQPLLPSDSAPQWLTLSVSPLDTWHSLRLSILGLAALVTTSVFVRSKKYLVQLLKIVFGAGCLEAAIGITQILGSARKLYWLVDAGQSGMLTAGSFVNHSHFSQFLNLAFGCGLALFFLKFDELEPSQNFSQSRRTEIASILIKHFGWIFGGLILCSFAVSLSLSRIGILSLAIAVLIVSIIAARRHGGGLRLWVLGLIPTIVIFCLVFYGFDTLYDRLATLESSQDFKERGKLNAATLTAGRHYPIMGSGIGTYGVAFPEFDNSGTTSIAAYADNDYLQMFMEGGIPGLAIILVFAWVVMRGLRATLRDSESMWPLVGGGLMVGVIAVAIHSFTDFGQRIPAVFLATAAVASVLASATAPEQHPSFTASGARNSSYQLKWIIVGNIAVLVLISFGWLLVSSYRHYEAESWWSVAQSRENELRDANWQGADEDYYALLVAAENSIVWEPLDWQHRYWLNYFRWIALDPAVMVGNLDDDTREIVTHIIDDLARVRLALPLFGPTYVLEATIRESLLGQSKLAGPLFRRGAELSQNDPLAQVAFGEWAARHGAEVEARYHLSAAAGLSDLYFDDVARIIVDDLNDPEFAVELAGDDYERLTSLTTMLKVRKGHIPMIDELTKRADELIKNAVENQTMSPAQLASLARKHSRQGDQLAAIKLYRQSLAADYKRFEWRIELAQCLGETGEVSQALREVRICLRLRPQHQLAIKLAEELVLKHSQLSSQGDISRSGGN
jgi:hypothetical protein